MYLLFFSLYFHLDFDVKSNIHPSPDSSSAPRLPLHCRGGPEHGPPRRPPAADGEKKTKEVIKKR